jgi:predicted nucleotide-binding protein (sugar kinase/HSP70/actin superfamily)
LLSDRFDHSTEHILHEVDGIFSNHINGEAILSIGGALAFAKEGYNGVVNAMPFTCMPSTIASSILKVQMRNQSPYVDMIYDGTILPNRETNLATFVFQAKQNLEKNGRKG